MGGTRQSCSLLSYGRGFYGGLLVRHRDIQQRLKSYLCSIGSVALKGDNGSRYSAMIDVEELIEQLKVIAYDDIPPVRRAQLLHVIVYLEQWAKDHNVRAN